MTKSVLHKLALGQGISCHAWNKDRTMLAVSPNSNFVQIYQTSDATNADAKWELVHELHEHDQLVSAIDWAPETNRIVTVSFDRNAYVWTYELLDGRMTWKPTLVILRVNRAATSVKWSPDEKKFAVGSGSKCVPVCYYDEEPNWWVSKIIKKHKSTVLSVDWHPSAPYIATGSSDLKCRIFSCFVKDVDSKDFGKVRPFGGEGKPTFGEVVMEFPSNGWVHSVRWSPSGNTLAFCSHDSSVTFYTVGGGTQVLKLSSLPFRTLLFLNDVSLVGVGHELNPTAFRQTQQDAWVVSGKIDKEEVKVEAQQSAAKAAFAMFQNQAKKATSDSASTDLATLHQNSVNGLVPFSYGPSGVNTFSSSGLDGHLVLWQLGDDLESALSKLTL